MFNGQRTLTRRQTLRLGLLGAGSAALVVPLARTARGQRAVANRLPQSQLPPPFQVPFAVPPVLRPVLRDDTTDFYQVIMKQARVQILPGFGPTTVYGYNGFMPGPTIKVRRGRQVVLRAINRLPATSYGGHPTHTSVHLHGSTSLPQYDGYASDVLEPGEFKDYRYPNIQSARTLWYHDHAAHITAQNGYMGLTGQYHIQDDLEQGLGIPQGKYDVPLTITDKIFAPDGSFFFEDQDHSSLFGDVILVNGRPWPVMKVERRKYRFRVLNASTSRSYRLQLDTGDLMTVIGTDGGLAPRSQTTPHLRIGAGERYEVVIDFAPYAAGRQIVLKNLSNPGNQNFASTAHVMRFDVVDPVSDPTNNSVPDVLNPGTADQFDRTYNPMHLMAADATGPAVRVTLDRFPEWNINGATWSDVVAGGFRPLIANPALNQVQIWELTNSSGSWHHPLHIHLVDVKILDRNGHAPFPYERGPKDVVYLGTAETIRVIGRFGPHEGRYMLHCHNLTHGDHDMMHQFQVGRYRPANDPINADPAKPIAQMTPLGTSAPASQQPTTTSTPRPSPTPATAPPSTAASRTTATDPSATTGAQSTNPETTREPARRLAPVRRRPVPTSTPKSKAPRPAPRTRRRPTRVVSPTTTPPAKTGTQPSPEPRRRRPRR